MIRTDPSSAERDRAEAAAILDPAPGRAVMVVGSYGSGKTEFAVNLALLAARAGRRVQIADLDLVNPYFRCREAAALMASHGIRVVAPPGALGFADLPIVLPELAGMLAARDDVLTLFDVGGDDVGARVLASLSGVLGDDGCELWQVVNAMRPFTGTLAGCRTMRDEIERAARLPVTGLVGNTHLVHETSPRVVLDGWRLTGDAARELDLPLRCVGVMEELADAPELAAITDPVLRMRRHMLPPWITARRPDRGAPRPIGRPPAAGAPGLAGGRHG